MEGISSIIIESGEVLLEDNRIVGKNLKFLQTGKILTISQLPPDEIDDDWVIIGYVQTPRYLRKSMIEFIVIYQKSSLTIRNSCVVSDIIGITTKGDSKVIIEQNPGFVFRLARLSAFENSQIVLRKGTFIRKVTQVEGNGRIC